jgi:hypothetical protein
MVDFRNQWCNHYFHQTDRSFADKDSRPSCALIIPTSSPIVLFSFGTHEKGQHATRASRQETQIRHQDIPFDHRMRQDCSVMQIDKKSMMQVLHREHAFSDMFVAYSTLQFE